MYALPKNPAGPVHTLSIEGIGYEDCLTTFFRLPTSKDAVMPSANFAVLFVQKRAAFPCTFLCFCLPFLSAPKILYEASKILAKKLLPFCHASKQKDPLFSCTVCAWYGLCRGTAAGLHSKQGQPQILLRKLSGLWGIRPSTAFTGAENFPAKKSFPPGVRLT